MRTSDWSSDVCSSDLHVAGIAVRIGHLFDHRIFGRSVVRIAESGQLAVWSPEACIEPAGMRIDRARESLADRRRVDRRDVVGFRQGIGQHFPGRISIRLVIVYRISIFSRNPGTPRSDLTK